MIPTQTFATVLEQAELLHDAASLDAAIRRMAASIDADYAGQERPVFMTVMQGGLFFAARLAMGCRTDFEFDYVHATRYRGTAGGGLKWIKEPGVPLAGRNVLLVDDILDEGPTLHAIHAHCRAQGAASVRIAVLADKKHDRRTPGIEADYVGVTVPDRYVFGYGMDWHGHGRNLEGIWAMAEVPA
jgi:hypoxanthine phosphoribosyltransferase